MDAGGIPPHQKKGLQIGALLGFHDESGFSDRPTVRRTWSRRGITPIVKTAGGWKTRSSLGTIVVEPDGSNPRFFLSIKKQTVHTEDIICYLKQMKRHLGGRKLILLWDGLTAHRSKQTLAYLKTQKSWLTVERLPSYAPELNPQEYAWANMKTKDHVNTCSTSLEDLDDVIRRGAKRIRRNQSLLRGFLKASGLFC